MPVRKRGKMWHYRFWVDGHEYSGSTDLPATKQNQSAALRKEAAARELVVSGRAQELRLSVKPFSEAVEMYLDWCAAEYREHPNTAARIRTSFASIAPFLRAKSVASITAGDIEDYKVFRRTVNQVKEITLRHDLHALSGFFQYAARQKWCRVNPVEEVDIPSDMDAVRMHVLSAREERLYFQAIDELAAGANVPAGCTAAALKAIAAYQYGMLRDAARLMLLQGPRPSEVLAAQAEDVRGEYWQIQRGKSRAARRLLRLTTAAQMILEARKVTARKQWLFASLRSPGRPATTFQRSHDEALERCGLDFVLYDLRHTFATRAAAAGMPITTLAAILGHSNLRSVMKYVHTQQSDIDAAMDRLDPMRTGRKADKTEREGNEYGRN